MKPTAPATRTRILKDFIYRAINHGAEAACVSLEIDHAEKDRLFLNDVRFTAARNAAADELLRDLNKLLGLTPGKVKRNGLVSTRSKARSTQRI
jgi:hypothetical protein